LFQQTVVQTEEVDTQFSLLAPRSTFMVDGTTKCSTTIFGSMISPQMSGLTQIFTTELQDGITPQSLFQLFQPGNSSFSEENKLNTTKVQPEALENILTQVAISIWELFNGQHSLQTHLNTQTFQKQENMLV
jgi:hypothetical protein